MRKVSTVFLSLLLLTSYACLGRSIDSDVSYKSLSRAERQGIKTIRVNVRVVSESKRPIKGVKVSAEGGESADAGVSSSDGLVIIDLELLPDDGVEFKFVSQRPRIDATTTMHRFPKGKEEVGVLFIVDRGGDVRMAEVEY